MTYGTEIPSIISLGQEAHHLAKDLAAEQSTPQVGKRVYLNTLAVYAGDSYLRSMGIETNLTAGDSWKPGLCGLLDAADLVLPRVGARLECRPVLPEETDVTLPITAAEDLIGYLAVQFSNDLSEVQLLGFAPATTNVDDLPGKIKITDLQPLDALIKEITQRETANAALQVAVLPDPPLVRLRRWFQGTFEADWQAFEGLFGTSALEPRLVFRKLKTSLGRVKPVDLGVQLAEHPVALAVSLRPKTDPVRGTAQKFSILVQVHPLKGEYLPEGLELIVFEESGRAFDEVSAGSTDKLIETQQFSGEPGERFMVEIALGGTSVIENFVT